MGVALVDDRVEGGLGPLRPFLAACVVQYQQVGAGHAAHQLLLCYGAAVVGGADGKQQLGYPLDDGRIAPVYGRVDDSSNEMAFARAQGAEEEQAAAGGNLLPDPLRVGPGCVVCSYCTGAVLEVVKGAVAVAASQARVGKEARQVLFALLLALRCFGFCKGGFPAGAGGQDPAFEQGHADLLDDAAAFSACRRLFRCSSG